MPSGRIPLVLLTVAGCTPLAEFDNTVAEIDVGPGSSEPSAMTLRLSADGCPSAHLRASVGGVLMRQTDAGGSGIGNWGGGSQCGHPEFTLDFLDDLDPSAPLEIEVTDGTTTWTVGDSDGFVERSWTVVEPIDGTVQGGGSIVIAPAFPGEAARVDGAWTLTAAEGYAATAHPEVSDDGTLTFGWPKEVGTGPIRLAHGWLDLACDLCEGPDACQVSVWAPFDAEFSREP